MPHLIDFILHIDKHLLVIAESYGPWALAILFVIIFCETGLVVTPFLPGDSLLFAAGSLAAAGMFQIAALILILFAAAVLGDTLNYHLGKYLGPKVLRKQDSWIFKRSYIERTERFYEKYGAKTIVVARFVPIVRTFAPFLAGVGAMRYSKFISYNIFGALLWVGIFVPAGYFFGSLPFVQKNFGLVVIVIIALSVLPIVFEYIKARREVTAA